MNVYFGGVYSIVIVIVLRLKTDYDYIIVIVVAQIFFIKVINLIVIVIFY